MNKDVQSKHDTHNNHSSYPNLVCNSRPEMDFANLLNQTIWCRVAPSNIQGVGLIAIRNIPIGIEFGKPIPDDVELTQKQLAQLIPEIRDYLLELFPIIDGKITIISPNNILPLGEIFINHSRTPNTNGFRTIQIISKGDELTKDYKIINFDQLKYWEFL